MARLIVADAGPLIAFGVSKSLLCFPKVLGEVWCRKPSLRDA